MASIIAFVSLPCLYSLRAYYSSGSRPKVSAHQWAMGRVKSFVSGKGGARKADADLLKGKKKTVKKKRKA